jgi:AsmA protein
MRSFGGEGSGSLHVDHSGAVPLIHLEYALNQFRIDEYFKALLPGVSASGLMHSSITLSMRGRTRGELRRSAAGEMVLSGTNLTLSGIDLDRDLARYESSQNFNLFDVTALVFAGPLGLAVTKGAQFASLAAKEGGSTPIRTVVSKWKIERGVAQAKDVALTTRENRLALHGGLDFVNDDFDDVVIALVDSRGCAKVRQKIRGTFDHPVVEKPDAFASITGPFRNLAGKLEGGRCEVFYSGSVAPAG